ncbi:hypothetical protein BB559_000304 [Furculomyces boomerangus]|uniref:Uncharacterized protein n=2 Tax=Harpellales TaxID=61421 RepID=A0A2T9Z5M2_9FUNG|nr:hypothetical protein BB559_000304 [Furculomyces boomerangus]PWA02041.1 hypothetical protein BB558_001855 [Smittium angustum]
MDIDWCMVCDKHTNGGLYCGVVCFERAQIHDKKVMQFNKSVLSEPNIYGSLVKRAPSGLDFDDYNTIKQSRSHVRLSEKSQQFNNLVDGYNNHLENQHNISLYFNKDSKKKSGNHSNGISPMKTLRKENIREQETQLSAQVVFSDPNFRAFKIRRLPTEDIFIPKTKSIPLPKFEHKLPRRATK